MYVQEVDELADDRPRRDDAEADPDTPHVSAEHGDDFVPEELHKTYDAFQSADQRTTSSRETSILHHNSREGRTARS